MSSIKDFELAQRIHVATHELKARIAALEAERDQMRQTLLIVRTAIVSVLCDHDENPCFVGTDGDRNVIRAAIRVFDAAIAKLEKEQGE